MIPSVLLLAASAAAPLASPQAEPTVFVGATFHTGFEGGEQGSGATGNVVEAVLAHHGRILALGSEASVSGSEAARGALRVDFGGAHVFPGFQDSHVHIERFGASLDEVNLVGCADFEELIRRVRERAAELPAGEWIEGRGWDQTLWAGGDFPVHARLSKAVPDHPVLVRRVGDGAALANLAALQLAGLAGEVLPDDPKGGAIVRASSGRATGVVLDTAVPLITKHIPAATAATRMRRILRAQEAFVAQGVTCVHDMGTAPSALPLMRAMQEDGRLRLRVAAYVDALAFDGTDAFRACISSDDGDVLVVTGAEFRLDGALGSRGAALFADYSDGKGERGFLRLDLDDLARRVSAAGNAGLQPAISAVGDRANHMALDAIERARDNVDGFAALLPRIEHVQVVAAVDLARYGELGVLPSMQPLHVTSDMRWVLARLGKDRAGLAYAWRSLSDATIMPLAFGSDVPIEAPSVLAGVYAALTRQDASGAPKGGFLPNERLTATETLAAYTSGAAAAARQGDRRGRIAIGYLCDLTAVDTDLSSLTRTSADAALRAKILVTVINGHVVYSRN